MEMSRYISSRYTSIDISICKWSRYIHISVCHANGLQMPCKWSAVVLWTARSPAGMRIHTQTHSLVSVCVCECVCESDCETVSESVC